MMGFLQASALVMSPLERPRPYMAPKCGPRNGTGKDALMPKPRERRPKPTRARRGCCLYGQIILGSRESLRKTHFFSLLWAHSQRKWEGESRRSALIYTYANNWAAETCKQTSAQQNHATPPPITQPASGDESFGPDQISPPDTPRSAEVHVLFRVQQVAALSKSSSLRSPFGNPNRMHIYLHQQLSIKRKLILGQLQQLFGGLPP